VSNEVIIFEADTATAVTGSANTISPVGTINFTYGFFQDIDVLELTTAVNGGTTYTLQFLDDAIFAVNNNIPVNDPSEGPTFAGVYGDITFLTYAFDAEAGTGQLTYTYEYTAATDFVDGSPPETFTFDLQTVQGGLE